MKTKKYSYTKLNTFNNCPLKYKFIYLDKLKKKDEGIEGFLGKLIHRSLEWIYKQKLDNNKSYFSLDQIINKFKEYWDEKLLYNYYIYLGWTEGIEPSLSRATTGRINHSTTPTTKKDFNIYFIKGSRII